MASPRITPKQAAAQLITKKDALWEQASTCDVGDPIEMGDLGPDIGVCYLVETRASSHEDQAYLFALAANKFFRESTGEDIVTALQSKKVQIKDFLLPNQQSDTGRLPLAIRILQTPMLQAAYNVNLQRHKLCEELKTTAIVHRDGRKEFDKNTIRQSLAIYQSISEIFSGYQLNLSDALKDSECREILMSGRLKLPLAIALSQQIKLADRAAPEREAADAQRPRASSPSRVGQFAQPAEPQRQPHESNLGEELEGKSSRYSPPSSFR